MFKDLLQFIRNGQDRHVRENMEHRRKALTVTLYIAVPTVLIFSPVNYFAGHRWLGALELAVGLILLPICLTKKQHHSLPLFETLMMGCAILIFGALWVDGGIANTGIYWMFIYPFVAFYVTGLRIGWLWTGMFMVLLLLAFVAQAKGLVVFPYSHIESIQFGFAFLFYSLIACMFEFLREYWHAGLLVTNRRLEQEIGDRKEAQEARLQAEAQLLHDEKLKSLGVLASGITHDFNHLLDVIMRHAEMARRDAKPAGKLAKNMMQIEESCKQAAEFCTQLSSFSGKGKTNLHHVNLNDMAREVSDLLRARIAQGVQVKLHLAPDISTVKVDVPRLHQVISNLMLNASEAIDGGRDGGEGTISLATGMMQVDRHYLNGSFAYEVLPEGGYVFIEVSDTGCGMNAETMAHIFDPFFTTRQYGRGMGLPVALGVMRGHQGAIHVESGAGMGSRFRILLPPAEEKRVTPVSPVEDWHGSGLVLVVDGDDLVRKLSCRMLEKMGFETISASDGKQALAYFEEKADELVAIILDYSIPDMNGGKVLLALYDVQTSVPVVLCSAFTRQDVLDRFRAQGISGFLHKPFSRVQLQAVLRDVLKKP